MTTKYVFGLAQKALTEEKPNSAVTDWIERLCSEKHAKQDYDFIPELVESVNLQATGPTEASRAIRKKLKYGNVHRQIRALFILKALVENCNDRFQNQFADSQLVDRIKIMASDPAVDAEVKKMLYAVLSSWRNQFKDDPSKKLVASLYNEVKGGGNDRAYQAEQIRLRKAEDERSSARRRELQDEASQREVQRILAEDKKEEAVRLRQLQATRGASLVLAEAKKKAAAKEAAKKQQAQPARKRVVFDLEKEKSNVLLATATATQACHGLVNALQRVNREKESVTTNEAVQESLAKVKEARKKVVRYIQLVETDASGEYIGTLISTNEQIIAALQLYDRWSKPAEHDSEDEAETGVSITALASAADGNQAELDHLAVKTSRIKLERRHTELDKLQDRQAAEVDRLNRARAKQTTQQVHPDLADLNFDATDLPEPLQPRHVGDDESIRSSGDDGLSDYSDYESSDEELHRSQASSSTSMSTHAKAGNRAYAQFLDRDEQQKLGKGSLLKDNDPFADPFADEPPTPGVNDKQRMEWREV